MTSRPVFERPRLMRTLLCLLIGVLALLWRAVPSFSWVPRDCYPEFHCHSPCPGDGFVWLCCAISGPNYVCGDEIRVQYWNGSGWQNMPRYSETYLLR